jgi:hypothetical protein
VSGGAGASPAGCSPSPKDCKREGSLSSMVIVCKESRTDIGEEAGEAGGEEEGEEREEEEERGEGGEGRGGRGGKRCGGGVWPPPSSSILGRESKTVWLNLAFLLC